MRVKIKNLTNSPYHLTGADGETVILPAKGELTDFEPHPMQISHYRALGYFEITQDNEKPEPKKPKKPNKDPSSERAQAQKDGKDGGGKK